MKLSDIKKLHQKKFRTQFACYLVEGEHLVLELCKAMAKQTQNKAVSTSEIILYITTDKLAWAKDLPVKFTLIEVTAKQMLDMSDTKTPQGVMALVPFSQSFTAQKEKPHSNKYVYLYEVQDPGNLGTILRTLAWFGQFKLLLSPNCVDPFNSKVIRASMGAIFHIDIEQDVALDELHSRFDTFAYLDINGRNIKIPEFTDFQCYLFGNEARGVPHKSLSALNAEAFTIKGSGNIDSLNLASAVNICVFQLSQH